MPLSRHRRPARQLPAPRLCQGRTLHRNARQGRMQQPQPPRRPAPRRRRLRRRWRRLCGQEPQRPNPPHHGRRRPHQEPLRRRRQPPPPSLPPSPCRPPPRLPLSPRLPLLPPAQPPAPAPAPRANSLRGLTFLGATCPSRPQLSRTSPRPLTAAGKPGSPLSCPGALRSLAGDRFHCCCLSYQALDRSNGAQHTVHIAGWVG